MLGFILGVLVDEVPDKLQNLPKIQMSSGFPCPLAEGCKEGVLLSDGVVGSTLLACELWPDVGDISLPVLDLLMDDVQMTTTWGLLLLLFIF